jgi:branched-chain amino acid transport system substrate-binding protein
LAVVATAAVLARAEPPAAKIAVQAALTGPGAFSGQALLEGIRFAVDEANTQGGPPIDLQTEDDTSTNEGARAAAQRIAASGALVVLGPSLSGLALTAGPVYAKAGIAAIVSTAHADAITENATTFRTVASTGDIGEALANYLARVLGGKRAIVIFADDGYGRPLADRFRKTGERLHIRVELHAFRTPAERDAAGKSAQADPEQPPLIFGMTQPDVVALLTDLRRQGYHGAILGTTTMARASFAGAFAKEPEEQRQLGFFTDGVYAASPMILDSANDATLAFARRFQARLGHEPSWEAAQAYDAVRLAMAAVRAVLASAPADTAAARKAVVAYLASLNGPASALTGLTGPIWFDLSRVRAQTVRIGRFHQGLFESAPLQLVAVANPDATALASGEVFDLGSGHYARLQHVVYTGVFINEITGIDLAKASFGADFYLWMRYAREVGESSPDPTDLIFPNMLSGRFDRDHPAEQGQMPDGTEYRLWRVDGQFRNDFDLRRFPFDEQRLAVTVFNARAATDRIVYVLDRRSPAGAGSPTPAIRDGALAAAAADLGVARLGLAIASPAAFRNLSQWRARDARSAATIW